MKNGWRTIIKRKQLLHFSIHFQSLDSIVVVQLKCCFNKDVEIECLHVPKDQGTLRKNNLRKEKKLEFRTFGAS
jgi:hypothetical protein